MESALEPSFLDFEYQVAGQNPMHFSAHFWRYSALFFILIDVGQKVEEPGRAVITSADQACGNPPHEAPWH